MNHLMFCYSISPQYESLKQFAAMGIFRITIDIFKTIEGIFRPNADIFRKIVGIFRKPVIF